MFSFLSALLLLLPLSYPLICNAASFDGSTNVFDVPGPAGQAQTYDQNRNWPIGSLQEIKFITDIDSWNLSLVQQDLTVNAATIITNITSGSQVGSISFNWTVDNHDADLSASPVFFFWVNKDTSDAFTSHYFNMTLDTTTVTGPSNPSMTPASSASSAAASASTTMAPSSASIANSSSNTGTSIGLGVGLGLGIPTLLAIAGFWYWRRLTMTRKSRAAQSPMLLQHSQYGGDYTRKDAPLVHATEEPADHHALSELQATPAEPRPIELPTDT